MKKSIVQKLAKRVREVTDDGTVLIQFLADVMEGRVEGATSRDRIEAAKQLHDWGFGKVPQSLEVTGEIQHTHVAGKVDLSRLTITELNALRATLRAASERTALPESTATSGEVIDVTPCENPSSAEES